MGLVPALYLGTSLVASMSPRLDLQQKIVAYQTMLVNVSQDRMTDHNGCEM